MLNVSSLTGVRTSSSDALRYGWDRPGERTPNSSTQRRPVVVWNSTRACNLACAHCYASAKSGPAPDELSTDEARTFFDDLAAFGVPAVLLSGGEPLTRPDLLDLVAHGTAAGLRFTLSTNGTLIDDRVASALASAGVIYAGVSLDGREPTHDRLRREPGAWQRSVASLGVLRYAGVKRGIRFTLTPDNESDLDAVLDLAATERVERFCLYHLVPSGRGRRLDDITPEQRRDALGRVFSFAFEHPEVEVLTVDNPADGPALYHWLAERDPQVAARCREGLAWNRGATAGPGIGLAAVDERGDVHVDQFSRHHTVGNVRCEPFSVIWSRPADPYLQSLRADDRPLPAPCRECPDHALCGGGLRTRAEAHTGDPWGFDPSCSLLAGVPPAHPEPRARLAG